MRFPGRSTAAALVVGALALAGCAAPVPQRAVEPVEPAAARSEVLHLPPLGDVEPLVPAPAPALPVSVPSADGTDVTVERAERILAVDLYGTLAEIVFSLGLGDRVVGRDASTGFASAAHLPMVTVGGHTLSAEAILDLDPDVVLVDASIGPPEVLDQLRGAGVAVVHVDPERTVAGIGPQIRAVATALGVPDAGEELATRTETELAAAAAAVRTVASGGADRPRVAFLYLRGSAVALLGGPGSGADELLTAVGAEDAGTAVGLSRPFVPITSEALVGAAPDVLLLLEGGLATVAGLDGLLAVPGVAQTPAGESRRVVTVADTELLGFGPRTPRVVRALAEAVAAVMADDDVAPAGTVAQDERGAG